MIGHPHPQILIYLGNDAIIIKLDWVGLLLCKTNPVNLGFTSGANQSVRD